MKTLLLTLIFMLVPAQTAAQETSIEGIVTQIKTTVTVTIDGVDMKPVETVTEGPPAYLVRTTLDKPIVRAYKKDFAWSPPIFLDYVSEGVYVLQKDPGTSWNIEVISVTTDAPYWASEYFEVSFTAPPVPPVAQPDFELDPPIAPEPEDADNFWDKPRPNPPVDIPATTKWQELQRITAQSSPVTTDREHSEAYADALESALEGIAAHPTLPGAKIKARAVRHKTFTGRIDQSWNVVFEQMSNQLEQATDVGDYVNGLRAIIRGLRLEVPTGSIK